MKKCQANSRFINRFQFTPCILKRNVSVFVTQNISFISISYNCQYYVICIKRYLFAFQKNRLHKIKYKTGRHKMVKRGHATIYLLFMLLKLLWWFNFILQLSPLSLSLSLPLFLNIICVFVIPFSYIIYATTSCNLFSHQTLFCVSSFPQHIWYDTGFCDKKLTFIGI